MSYGLKETLSFEVDQLSWIRDGCVMTLRVAMGVLERLRSGKSGNCLITSISGNEEVRGGKCGSRSDCQDSRVIEYTLMLSDYSGFSSLSPFRNSFSLNVLLFA